MGKRIQHRLLAIALCIIAGGGLFGCNRGSDSEIAKAEAAYEKREFSQAVALSDSVLRKDPASLGAHRVKALASISQGEIEGTFNDYDRVEKKYPAIAPSLLREICIGMIKQAMTHENYFIRSSAVKAIGEMGDPSLIPLIIPGFKDQAPFVRFFTVEAVGQLGGPEAVKLLLAAGSDPDGMVRVAAVKSLDDLASPPAGIDVKNLLASFLNDGEITVKLFTLAALAKRGDEKATSELLESGRTLQGPARSAVAAALGRSKRAEAAPILIKMLTDSDKTLRMYAAEALGEMPAAGHFDPLAKALGDTDPATRGAAATSLGKLGDAKAIPLLEKRLGDPDPIVRVSAAEGLARLGKKEIPVYETALRESDYAVRHFAVGSLRKVGGKEALPILTKGLSDEAQRVRIAVVRAIGEIGGPDAIPILKTSLKDPDASVRTYAAGNVGRLLGRTQEIQKKKEKKEGAG
ncbi:MAG: HEAT repeat domain-containing protein [Candidatus Manganitrophaceae bacterium]